jgi:hypothetical protein
MHEARRLQALAAVLAVGLVALSPFVVLGVVGADPASVRGANPFSAEYHGPDSPLAVPRNATDCGLLPSAVVAEQISTLGWPSNWTGDVMTMYGKLCGDPQFTQALLEWGALRWEPPLTINGTTMPGYWVASNFTLQFYGSGPPSPVRHDVDFVVGWYAATGASGANSTVSGNCTQDCVWDDTWIGSLPGTNYTGPNLTVEPAICTGCLGVYNGSLGSTIFGSAVVLVGLLCGVGVGARHYLRHRRAHR